MGNPLIFGYHLISGKGVTWLEKSTPHWKSGTKPLVMVLGKSGTAFAGGDGDSLLRQRRTDWTSYQEITSSFLSSDRRKINRVFVLETDSGGCQEYGKALERTLVKELGNLAS